MPSIGGTVHLACGCELRYDDEDAEHRANRLSRTLHRPQVTCRIHGPATASCAVSGPAALLWPQPDDRREAEYDALLSHQE